MSTTSPATAGLDPRDIETRDIETRDIEARDIETLNIISSHSISSKATRCLAVLLAPNPTPPRVIGLRAKSPTASKAVTIAEIAKRRVEEANGEWFQYNVLTSKMEEVKPRQKPADAMPEKEDGDGDEDPFARLPEKENGPLRAMPVLTIYISRTRLPALAKAHGEQRGGTAAA